MVSDDRAMRLAEAESFWDGEARMRELHGMEAWLPAPGTAAMKAPPPRFKMAIVSFLAVSFLCFRCFRASPPRSWSRCLRWDDVRGVGRDDRLDDVRRDAGAHTAPLALAVRPGAVRAFRSA